MSSSSADNISATLLIFWKVQRTSVIFQKCVLIVRFLKILWQVFRILYKSIIFNSEKKNNNILYTSTKRLLLEIIKQTTTKQNFCKRKTTENIYIFQILWKKTLYDYCHYIHLHFVTVLIMFISGVIISFRFKLHVKKFWLNKNGKIILMENIVWYLTSYTRVSIAWII